MTQTNYSLASLHIAYEMNEGIEQEGDVCWLVVE
jgi:hypothetical protein